MLKPGDPAPEFELPSADLEMVQSSALFGKTNLVIYFYPKDMTPGCTVEAQGFRDKMKDFDRRGAVVVGVSADSAARHEKFIEKECLPFALLSDEDHAMMEKYGVWKEKSMYGRKYMGIERSTFLIDGQGKIAGVWRNVKVPGHVEDVAAAIVALNARP